MPQHPIGVSLQIACVAFHNFLGLLIAVCTSVKMLDFIFRKLLRYMNSFLQSRRSDFTINCVRSLQFAS